MPNRPTPQNGSFFSPEDGLDSPKSENTEPPPEKIKSHWWDCLTIAGPAVMGYLALGGAFGVVFVHQGHPWYASLVMGFFVYAGAAQFLSISLLAAQAGVVDVFVAIFLLNFRHIFYGLALEERFRKLSRLKKLYALFSLSDETFSLLAANKSNCHIQDSQRIFTVSLINHIFWVLGCGLGALMSKNMPFSTEGLEFSLTALFLVLFLEQWMQRPRFQHLMFAIAAAIIGLIAWNGEVFLPLSIGLCALYQIAKPALSPQTLKEPKETHQ